MREINEKCTISFTGSVDYIQWMLIAHDLFPELGTNMDNLYYSLSTIKNINWFLNEIESQFPALQREMEDVGNLSLTSMSREIFDKLIG